MITYNRLWKKLIDLNLKKSELSKMSGVSMTSIAKLKHNENVNTEILNRICAALNCDISEILDYVSDK